MPVGIDATFSQGATKYTSPTAAYNSTNKIFKEFYLPAVHDLLNSKRILSRYVRRNTEDVMGAYAVVALNTSRNEGKGFVDEGGRLPEPGVQGYDRANYRMRYDYGRILVTGPAVASSRGDRGAWIRMLDAEIRGLSRDMMHENNRVLFGNGTGILARVSAINTGTTPDTYTLDQPGGFGTSNQGLGTQYLRVNMRVAMLDDSSASFAMLASTAAGTPKAAYIVGIDYANGTVQFASTPIKPGTLVSDHLTSYGVDFTGAAVGDVLVRVSEATATVGEADTGYMNEPFGLAAVVSDTDPTGVFSNDTKKVGEITSTNNLFWQAAIVDNNGSYRAFSQDLLHEAADLVDQVGDGTVQLWMTTHGIRRQYAAQLQANKRYVGEMTLDGGYKALEFDGRPMVVDKDCTRSRIYGLDLETLMIFQETDYQWMDADGSILNRLSDHDAYQATLYKYWEFGTNARNRNCAVFDILDQ